MKILLAELREKIRNLLTEDPQEDLLKRWGEKSEDPVDVALARIGILPVPQGHRSSSTVGEGSYNAVKEVLYKGRRCVARYSEEAREQQSMIDFVDFERMVDAKYAKHFPKLIDTFEVAVPGADKIYGTLMELLDPMPPALQHDLAFMTWNTKVSTSRIDMFLDNSAARTKIISRLCRAGSYGTDEIEHLFDNVAVPLLRKLSQHHISALDLESSLQAGMEDFDGGSGLSREIVSFIRSGVVPMTNGNNHLGGSHPSQKVQEFVEFLHALDEAGMEYDDLHTGNFMVRPGTGDFVVVDPGLFS